MANKHAALLILLFISLNVLCAQEMFFSELRFVQRLTWSGDGYAQFYQVIVEKESNNEFTGILDQRTNEFFIEVSLSPGNYRFRVIPYDYLDTPGHGTQWIDFEILPAIYPQLYQISYFFKYTVTENQLILSITGENIEGNAVIYLRTHDREILNPDETRVNEYGNGASIIFDDSNLFYDVDSTPKIYTLTIRNPSGLEASMRTSIAYVPPPPAPPQPPTRPPRPGFNHYFDTYFGILWMPLFVTYRDEENLHELANLEGAAISLGFVYKRMQFFHWGLELNFSWLNTSNIPHYLKGDINFLAQIFTPEKLFCFRFRFGAGAGISDSFDYTSFHLNFGFSFLWFIFERMYIELGVDSVFWTNDSDLTGSSSAFNQNQTGGIRPFIGLGWRINR